MIHISASKKNTFDKRVIRLAGAVLLLGILLSSVLVDPESANILSCRFKELTGLSCPTCGLSRSFYAFANFEFADSLIFHPFGPVFFIFGVIWFLKISYESATANKVTINAKPQFVRIALLIFLGFFILFWIVRMILE